MHRAGGLLTVLILLGLVAGAILGEVLHRNDALDVAAAMMNWGDLVLIRPLKLLVIPIVMLSVLVGVTSIGDPSRLGVIGGATLVYYLATMLAAVILGAVLVTSIGPGVGLDATTAEQLRVSGESAFAGADVLKGRIDQASEMGMGGAWSSILDQLIPANVFADIVAVRPLGVIVFSL
ncbi:MAG: cation:dicarboxylate symporter family transporter, partial [Phycisphaerales bacterium]